MHPLGTALLRRRIHLRVHRIRLRVHRIRLRVHREYGCDGVNCTVEGGGVLGGEGGGRAVSTLKYQIRNSYRQRADENIRTTIYAHFYRILEHVYFVYAFPIKECIVYLLSY